MANGDVIEYAVLQCTNTSGSVNYAHTSVSHDPYNNIVISPVNANAYINWIEYSYYGETTGKTYKTYIGCACIYYANYYEAIHICNNSNSAYTYTINEQEYTLRLMPASFWTDIDSTICRQLNNALSLTSSDKIFTSDINEDDTGSKQVQYSDGYFMESGFATYGYEFIFVPVLFRKNNLEEGSSEFEGIYKFGILTDSEFRLPRGTTSDHDWYISSNKYKTNYSLTNFAFTTATKYEKDHDMEWKWIKTTIDGTTMYISTTNSFIAYPPSYYYTKILDKYVCIDGKYYIFRILTVDQWKSLSTDILNQIDWGNTRTITSTKNVNDDRYYVGYNKSSGSWSQNTINVNGSSSTSSVGVIPVLEPVNSSIVKMGMLTMSSSSSTVNIGTNSPDYIYFDNPNNTSNKEWVKTTLNGKEILLATTFLSNQMSPANCKTYVNKIVYLGGNNYRIKVFSESEIRNLPVDVLRQVEFGDGTTKYYTYTTSTDSSGNSIYITYYPDGNNFATDIRYSSNSTSTFINDGLLVGLEYIGPGVDHVKLGAFKNSSGTILSPKKYTNQDFSSTTNEYLSDFNFTDTSDENYKWSWIKTELNGETILISKFLTGPDRYSTLLSNGIIGRTYTLENNKYELIILSESEMNQLSFEALYNIDFGYSSSASWGMHTNTVVSTNTIRTICFCTYRSFGEFGIIRSTEDFDVSNGRKGYYAILKLLNKAPTISGSDGNLGDKTSSFSLAYTVDDENPEDTLTITEKLNGTTIRTINNATRNSTYYFDVSASLFSNLAVYSTSTIEITVSDGALSATRTYTFRKTNTAPVINYSGNTNLGTITSKPTINYSVTDAEGDDITVTERLNGKTLRTITVSSGTSMTVSIPNSSWLACGSSTNTIEIYARDSAGGSSNRTITFARAIDRIEVITKPIESDTMPTRISLEVGWDTNNASGTVYVCNNGLDSTPTWEDMTDNIDSDNAYTFTNTSKTADKWGISVRVIVRKDGGSTGEVSLYSIKGTYE